MSEHDGPILTQEEGSQEAQNTLWLLRNLAPPRPVGEDPAYVPPGRWLLPPLREALTKLAETEALALAEVPKYIQYQAKMFSLRTGPDAWHMLAESAPEVRRLLLIREIVICTTQVIEDLENEGRPQPPPNLHLTRMRGTR